MTHQFRKLLLGSLLASAMTGACLMAVPAHAETPITVESDRARVVKLIGDPAAVIVGNPAFADVSIQAGRLIIHGKHHGGTNIMVLDSDGNSIANFDVIVVRAENDMVSVYKAGSRVTMTCAPFCDQQLTVGDNMDEFKKVADEMNQKNALSGAGAGN